MGDVRLRREARDGATRRGHDLGYFTTEIKAAGTLDRGVEAACRRCGMTAQVIPGYGHEVFGEAVAMDCPEGGE